MALRPMLLDVIAKTTTPTFTEATTRVFVFSEWEDTPGFVAVYIGRAGKPVLLALEPITSFTSTRFPRREPYRLTTQSGEEWTIFKGGCGCGSPIRRLTSRQALDDYAQSSFVGG